MTLYIIITYVSSTHRKHLTPTTSLPSLFLPKIILSAQQLKQCREKFQTDHDDKKEGSLKKSGRKKKKRISDDKNDTCFKMRSSNTLISSVNWILLPYFSSLLTLSNSTRLKLTC